MSSRNRRRVSNPRTTSAASPREVIDRLIAREQFKDAIKQAKILYRDESTPENHRLLERGYFERIRQLHQGGMDNSAREVAQHLLDFGVTDPDLVEPLAEALLVIGLPDRGLALQDRLQTPEVRERLTRQAADQAVLQNLGASVPPDLRAGVERVRSALQAVLSGEEARAQEMLREVARSSPFSDWKRFARGLAAYRRRESDEARAHWERLDPARAPARIARSLEALDRPSTAPSADNEKVQRALEPLERWAFHEPVLRPLRELAALVAQDRWQEAVQALGSLRTTLRRIDPELAVRLSQVLYDPVLRASIQLEYHRGQSLLKSFTRAAEPLPIDPRWNRLWALTWDAAGGDGDEAESYWKKYLEDLKTTDALRPEERSRAQSLVWLHLGRGHLEAAAELVLNESDPDPPTRQERKRAETCLEESLRLDPSSQAAYEALVTAYQTWNELEKAAALARRRLQAEPHDFDALLLLSRFHCRKNEPVEALEAAQKARA